MPSGCSFHPRCPYATELCARQAPPLFTIGNGHQAACFHRDRVTRRQDVWEETPPPADGTQGGRNSDVTDPLLTLDHVSREFSTRRGRITAVDDVSLQIGRGDILCLVGESGSGKTTVARMAAGLLEPTRGTVRFEGQ